MPIRISNSDLDERTKELVADSDKTALDIFRNKLDEIAASVDNIEDGDRKAALVHAVNNVHRTTGATGDFADSADLEETHKGKLKLDDPR